MASLCTTTCWASSSLCLFWSNANITHYRPSSACRHQPCTCRHRSSEAQGRTTYSRRRPLELMRWQEWQLLNRIIRESAWMPPQDGSVTQPRIFERAADAQSRVPLATKRAPAEADALGGPAMGHMRPQSPNAKQEKRDGLKPALRRLMKG